MATQGEREEVAGSPEFTTQRMLTQILAQMEDMTLRMGTQEQEIRRLRDQVVAGSNTSPAAMADNPAVVPPPLATQSRGAPRENLERRDEDVPQGRNSPEATVNLPLTHAQHFPRGKLFVLM